jgi:hypothetical protein
MEDALRPLPIDFSREDSRFEVDIHSFGHPFHGRL